MLKAWTVFTKEIIGRKRKKAFTFLKHFIMKTTALQGLCCCCLVDFLVPFLFVSYHIERKNKENSTFVSTCLLPCCSELSNLRLCLPGWGARVVRRSVKSTCERACVRACATAVFGEVRGQH